MLYIDLTLSVLTIDIYLIWYIFLYYFNEGIFLRPFTDKSFWNFQQGSQGVTWIYKGIWQDYFTANYLFYHANMTINNEKQHSISILHCEAYLLEKTIFKLSIHKFWRNKRNIYRCLACQKYYNYQTPSHVLVIHADLDRIKALDHPVCI